MALEGDSKAIKDLTNKKHDTNTLYEELSKDKTNDAVFKQDLVQANKALHQNGFPDLVIIDVKDGKFITNKGSVDGDDLNKRLDSTEKNSSKLQVVKDADGKTVKDVVLPNEKKMHFDYKGTTLVGYTDENGDRYERDDQTPPTWIHKNGPNGAGADASKNLKDVSVDEYGVVTTKLNDTDSKKVYPNGRVETTAADYNTVTENGTKISKSTDGTYEKIEYPAESGRGTVEMFLGPNGSVTKVRETIGDGAPNVTVNKDDSNNVVDINGKPVTATIDSSGTLTIKHSEKEVEIINPDGSGSKTDTNGNLVEVMANGQTTTITRDEKTGAATKISRGETVIATYDGEKKVWTDGKNVALKGEPKVDDSGKVTLDYSNGKVEINSDGTQTFTGRRSSIEVSADGSKASRVVQPKDTLWAIAEDNLSRTHPGADKPAAKLVLDEIRRIASKANPPIKSPYNVIHQGTKLDLSPEPATT